MKHLIFAFAILAAIHAAGRASAQHSDIVLVLDGNRLVTADDTTLLAEIVFEGELGELGIPGFADDPGYSSGSLAPNALVGYNVTRSLLFWDGEALLEPPDDERLEIRQFNVALTTVTGTSGFQSGPYFAQANSGGGIHTHLTWYVKHPTFNPGDPFNNPISTGAYVLFLEQTSDMHDTSDEYAIVFNNNLSAAEFEEAVDAVHSLLAPSCHGDLDGDGVIGLSDLSTLLTNFGVSEGATYEDGDLTGDGAVGLADLSELLTLFGTSCP